MSLRKSFRLLLVCLALCISSAGTLRAGVLGGDGIGAYGDSLSWQYSLWVPLSTSLGYPLYSNGHQFNWVDHLVMSGYNFGPQVDMTGNGNYSNQYNVALGGAVSGDLSGQVAQLQPYLASHDVKLTVLSIGGNDFALSQYQTIYNKAANVNYDPMTDPAVQTLINSVVSNITGAVNATLATDPGQHMVLTTIPDVGVTPKFRSTYSSASRRDDVSTVIDEINRQILDLAALHHMPVVDLNALTDIVLNPLTLAGVQIQPGGGNSENRMFLSDGFHPGTVLNGLLANAILFANQTGYGDPVSLISDQTILTRAGLTPSIAGPTYFDVSAYVIYVPEPSSFVLGGIAALGLSFTVLCRRGQQKSVAE